MILNMGGGGVVPKVNMDATTIIPGTVDQVIPLGTYLRGDVTVLGDANLIAENIPDDVTLFGIRGTRPDNVGNAVWKKSHKARMENVTTNDNYSLFYDHGIMGGSYSVSITYSNSYTLSEDGTYTLVSPVSNTISMTNDSQRKSIIGKYMIYDNKDGKDTSGKNLLKVITINGAYSSAGVTYLACVCEMHSTYIGDVDISFVVDNSVSKYPSSGTHTDGYYYSLLAQTDSANVMSLSNDALATVQGDYREQIENEVSE